LNSISGPNGKPFGGLNSLRHQPYLDSVERVGVRVEPGEIISVIKDPNDDSINYKYKVRLFNRAIVEAEVAAPQFDYATGAGIFGVAKRGSHVLVTIIGEERPSDLAIKRAYITGFISPGDRADGGARGHRHNLEQGSMSMMNDSGGGVEVRASGLVKILANTVCARYFIALRNIISDVCENYLLDTAGGRFEWTKKNDQSNQTTLELRAWRLLDQRGKDDKPHVRILIGDVKAKDPDAELTAIMQIEATEGDFSGAKSSKLTVDGDGTFTYTTDDGAGDGAAMGIFPDGTFTYQAGALGPNLTLDADDKEVIITDEPSGNELKMVASGDITITSKIGSVITMKASGDIEIDAKASNVDIKGTAGTATIDFPTVNLGPAPGPYAGVDYSGGGGTSASVFVAP
jgi:hypothetical protein